MSPFLDRSRWLDENELAFTIDQIGYEVSPGHCLICPKRLVASVFELYADEWDACRKLIFSAWRRLQVHDPRPDGYNIGVNCGEAAGQTVFHAHIHLIPRYLGDDPEPRGGVRACIPGKKSY